MASSTLLLLNVSIDLDTFVKDLYWCYSPSSSLLIVYYFSESSKGSLMLFYLKVPLSFS